MSRKSRAGLILAVLILVFPLVIVMIGKPSSVIAPNFLADPIGWLSQNFGFYYLEAISLSIVNFSFSAYLVNKRVNGRALVGRCSILFFMMLISMLTIPIVIIISPPHANYLRTQSAFVKNATTNPTTNPILNITQVSSNITNAIKTDPYLNLGYQIHWFFVYYGLSYGILGMVYGLISVLVTYTGSRCISLTRDNAKTLIQYIGMLSIIISIMIFAANNPATMFGVKYAFAVLPLMLAVLLLATGVIAAQMNDCNEMLSSRGIMFLLVSFAVGALFGSLIIPFTRSTYLGEPSWGDIYTVFPGIYFFMYSSMITVALLASIGSILRTLWR